MLLVSDYMLINPYSFPRVSFLSFIPLQSIILANFFFLLNLFSILSSSFFLFFWSVDSTHYICFALDPPLPNCPVELKIKINYVIFKLLAGCNSFR